MTTESIKVFCRIRPALGYTSLVEYDLKNDNSFDESETLEIFVPEIARSTHNKAASYEFKFNQIFDQNAEQEEVYQAVARPILDNALLGYNGTVFVYGQTATGKTYTIIGEQATEQRQINKKKREVRKNKFKTKPKAISTEASIDGPKLKKTEQTDPFPLLPGEIPDPDYVSDDHTPISDLEMPAMPENYGIVPRTMGYVFLYLSTYAADAEVKVAYYEIYKEHGYDLLSGYNKLKRAENLAHLTQIKAMTDGKQNLHMKNLSRHKVEDVSEALELLEHGNANRQVAETHLNDASSRSHTIFTIYLTIKQPETEVLLKPKLHLVDLAGSERIGKHHEKNDKIMAEGKNINLSLHHLQQVIVALSRKKSNLQKNKHHHVPYRNSTMTMVLKDSLGGNSCTAMIATISPEQTNLDESVSTCRFAQTVGTISNQVVINQVENPDVVIARLRQELQMAKQELENAVNVSRPMTTISEDERIELLELIREYLQAEDDDEILDVGFDQAKIQFCFLNLKQRWIFEREQNLKLRGIEPQPQQQPQLQQQLPAHQQPQAQQTQQMQKPAKTNQEPVKAQERSKTHQPPEAHRSQMKARSQSQPETTESKACIVM